MTLEQSNGSAKFQTITGSAYETLRAEACGLLRLYGLDRLGRTPVEDVCTYREDGTLFSRQIHCSFVYEAATGFEALDICAWCGSDTTGYRMGYGCGVCGGS